MVLTPDKTGSPAVGVMTSTDKSGQQQQQRSESSTSGIATGDESDNLPDDHDEQVSLHGYHNCNLYNPFPFQCSGTFGPQQGGVPHVGKQN